MGACCSGEESEDQKRNFEKTQGPNSDRRCTDVLWLPILMVYMAGFSVLCYYVIEDSNLLRLHHGKDHAGNLCGLGEMSDKPVTYFPRLSEDLKKDHTLRKRYGVCVEECPKQFHFVEDYDGDGEHKAERDKWFVSLPSFAFSNRCIPYKEPRTLEQETLCADPPCEVVSGREPQKPEEVCGAGAAEHMWVIGNPGHYTKERWKEAGLDKEQIQTRIDIANSSETQSRTTCRAILLIDTGIKTDDKDDSALHQFLTASTGMLVRNARDLYDNRHDVALLGGPFALLASFIVLLLFSYFARIIIPVLVTVAFAVLVCLDYILFVQAGMATGNTGRAIVGGLGLDRAVQEIDSVLGDISPVGGFSAEDATKSLLEKGDSDMVFIYQGCAWLLLAAILVLFCLCCALGRQYKILVALLRESATTIRQMPSMLLFPFVGCASLLVFLVLMARTIVGAMILNEDSVVDDYFVEQHEYGRHILVWVVIFSFLWIYAFHMAIFKTTVAGAVAHWYFYRNDPDRNAGTGIFSKGYFFGRPVLRALGRVFRYHLGTMAFGSFVIALCTMPRLLFEYLLYQTGEVDQSNCVIRCGVNAIRCCLYCLEKCVKNMTEMAYINVAVSGRGLCAAGLRVVELMAKYPAQMLLDRMASWSLKLLACTLVPAILIGGSYLRISKGWGVCAAFIGGMSVAITRIAVGVYDVCLSAMFMCAMRDMEMYQGQYASDSLRRAMGLSEPGGKATRASARELEMS